MPNFRRAAFCAVLLLLAPRAARAAGPMFTNTFVAFPGMTTPQLCATGDLNGDGIADLVATSSTVDSVYVLYGVGDGLFGKPTAWGTAPGPRGVAIGDINGDGLGDILIACFNGNVLETLPNIAGHFSIHNDLATASGPTALLFQDVTNDGVRDVVVTCRTDNKVSVFVALPSGALTPHVDYATGAAPVAVAAADFNANGRTDLVVANSGGNSLSVLLGFGGGAFSAGVTLALPAPPTAVGVGSFTGNGFQDVVATCSSLSNQLSYFRGNNDGTFRPATVWPLTSGPNALVVGDYNGDGTLDVAVSGAYSPLVYAKGLGNGTFVLTGAGNVGPDPRGLVALDANGDGRPDLLSLSPSLGSVQVALAGAPGAFGNAAYSGMSLYWISDNKLADFDGDGILDLASSSFDKDGSPSEFGVAVAHGHGDGTFGPETILLSLDSVHSIAGLAVADVTGDGLLDIVDCWTDGSAFDVASLDVFAGNGNGTFALNVHMAPGGSLQGVATGDLDGDGLADIVTTGSEANVLWVVRAAGGGTYAAPVSYPAGEKPFAVVLTDVDQDGVLDALVTYGSKSPGITYRASYSVFHGVGDGTFDPRADYLIAAPCFGIAASDFNEDGVPDVVTLQGPTKNVSIEFGSVPGTFGPAGWSAPLVGTVTRSNALRVADLNADGHADIVVSSDDWIVTVFLGRGDGTFEQRRDFGQAGEAMAIGDINGDFRPDMVVGHYGGDYSFLQQSAFLSGTGQPAAHPGVTPLMIRATRRAGRGGARIRLALARAADTRVDVLDVRGRLVRALSSGPLAAGVHEQTWDGRSDRGMRAPAGLYMVRVRAARESGTAKLLVL